MALSAPKKYEPFVLCEAELVSVAHSERSNLALLASDGLWDFLSPQSALKWLKKFLLVSGSLNGAATMLRCPPLLTQ